MSRGPYSILLMLAMSLPSAVRALGLGDIRVDSALNEPLSAQIDIVGATRDELAGLTANVANHDVFQRYGADRPAFLASATFKVGLDAQGRPVLNVRSADPFTDPLVSFLVDLRWGKSELVREYSLLLDPAGFNSSAPALASAAPSRIVPGAPANSAPLAAASGVDRPRALGAQVAAETRVEPESVADRHYKIAAGDTLRGIARRAGASTEPQMQRVMLAVFRANPVAFDGNVNRMHRGATLTLPTAADVASISSADAKREIRAQMNAWRVDGRPAVVHVASIAATPAVLATPPVQAVQATPAVHAVQANAAVQATAAVPGTPTVLAAPAVPGTPAVLAAPAAAPTTTAAVTPVAVPARVAKQDDSPDAALQTRVQFLERALDDMHKQLASEGANIQDLKEAAARGPRAAPQPVKAAVSPQPVLATVAPQSPAGKAFLGPMALVLAVLLAGFAILRKRMASRVPPTPAEVLISDTESIPEMASQGIATGPAVAAQIAAETAPSRKAPAAPVMAAAAPRRVDLGDSIADLPGKASSETTVSLEIDAEALERSYLDSLGVEATLDTVAVDASELDEGATNSELDTMVLDMKKAADKLGDAGLASAKFGDMEFDEANFADIGLDDSKLTDVGRHDKLTDLGLHDTKLTGLGLDDSKLAGLGLDPMLAPADKLRPVAADIELDYNLLDLDATAQHVHMPSDLHDRALVSERRTNIVDVLKVAIDQDPQRRDLRMKLLETYYSAAATNQRSFLEVVKKLKLERDQLSDDDWKKVMMMGREIAPTEPLFNELLKDDDDLAHCA